MAGATSEHIPAYDRLISATTDDRLYPRTNARDAGCPCRENPMHLCPLEPRHGRYFVIRSEKAGQGRGIGVNVNPHDGLLWVDSRLTAELASRVRSRPAASDAQY